MTADAEVAVSASQDVIAIYSPQSYELELRADLTGYRCRVMDLTSRRWREPYVAAGAVSNVQLSQARCDSLFVATRRAAALP